MNVRGRMRQRHQQKKALGWVFGGVGALIIGAIVVMGFVLHSNAPTVDRTTGCPPQYQSVTAVIIDLTDPISPIQAAALRNALMSVRDSVPKSGRLEIYPLQPILTTTIAPLFAACNPGSARDVDSPLYGNPELADRIWRRHFADRLDKVIENIQRLQPANTSPLFEGIQSVAVTAFGSPAARGASKKQLIIISDMLHYTPEVSMYDGAPDFQYFKSLQYYLRVKPDFRGASVNIYLIVRETRHAAQQPPLYKFWVDFVAASDGYLQAWEPLQ